MNRALFTWLVPEPLQVRLRERLADVDIELVFVEDESPEAAVGQAPNASVIVGWRYDDALLDAASECRLCINPGAGVLHLVDVFSKRADRPMVVNSHGNFLLTAQGAVALLLALTNQVPLHDRHMREGRWRKHIADDPLASRRLYGRKLGLVGYGHINRQVHRLLAGFELEVHALKTSWSDVPDGVTPHTDIDGFMDGVDTAVVAIPETDESRGLVDADALRRLGSSGLLVNIGRGPVVDEDALYEALRDRTIAGAALDVWYDYEPEADEGGRRYPSRRPFHELDNVVMSPHRAASPYDDLDRWDDVIDNLRRFVDGRPLRNVVDLSRGY